MRRRPASRAGGNPSFRGSSNVAVRKEAKLPAGENDELRVLSPRERTVLALIASDYSSKQIAAKLGITFKTVVSHRMHIMSKLDVHTVVGLTRLAIRCNLVSP